MTMRAVALSVLLWPGAAAAAFFTLEGHGGPVMGIATAPDGRIATGGFDNAVGLWIDREPTWLDGHDAAVNSVHFLADGGLVSASDDFSIRLWDLDELTVFEGHTGKVMGLASAPGIIASASWDGTIGLWPRDGGAPRFIDGHDGPVNAVALTADGSLLYSASADGTLRLWDVATGMEIETLVRHGFGINTLVLDEPGGWMAYGAVDGVTRIVDPSTGAEFTDFTGGRRPILAMTLSPDARNLAIGDGDGFIMVVDMYEKKVMRDFRATQRGPIWALAYTGDGGHILAGGIDPAVHAWPVGRLGDGQKLAEVEASFLRDPDTMSNGERQFARKCSICHSLTPGSERKAGPTLHDLFGRAAGTVDDYTYSDTLAESDVVWDHETIDKLFDLGPDNYVPGSKMPVQRITADEDRADLISYLRDATEPKEDAR